MRTLRATVASSLGVEEFVFKRVVKEILYAALDKRAAKDQRHRSVFSRPSHWKDNYGFIIPDGGGEGIYAHRDSVRAGYAVEDGDAVKFYIAQHYRDHDQATDIVPVSSRAAPPAPPSEASEDSVAAAPLLVIDVGGPRHRKRDRAPTVDTALSTKRPSRRSS